MGKRKDEHNNDSSSSKKQKKHKKHKKKREKSVHKSSALTSDAEEVDVVNNEKFNEEAKGLKLKIKFGGKTLSTAGLVSDSTLDEQEEQDEEDMDSEDIDLDTSSEVFEDQSSLKHSKDDEDKWLDALDKGELDDNGELKKEKKNTIFMTARQKALIGEKDEAMELLQQLPMYPERNEEEIEEIERKRKLKAKKRKQQMQRQIEESKTQTVEKLLKGQSKKDTSKHGKHSQKKLGAHIRYISNAHGCSLSYTQDVDEMLQPKKLESKVPAADIHCSVDGCSNLKKYSCSKSNLPICSLQCYKLVNMNAVNPILEVS